ncbi:hypothetical protein [Maribellus sp. YY47]|uniref:hypothetical protein n=1 Tax=Maribellus sp. YY47 TaxID=2929486 RepID=UPI002000B841|nr:hypothetical protein [Maribellus sp. YY47]MCK3684944.1 hypothetical protein [Maribellus sp. YY47]
MTTIVARHKVGDFNTWLKGHKDREEVFAPAISGFKTFRDANDPNSIALVIEVTDMEKLQSIIDDPANAELQKKHTVLRPIMISLPVDI